MVLKEHQILNLKKLIQTAIIRLYDNDNSLILRGGMERSVSFRFALYLADELAKCDWLREFDLDMEYNKNGDNPKRTPRRPSGAQPDLILHRRGNNLENILVVEIKGWWNEEPRKNDYIKLEDFIHQEGEYKYGLGAYLELGKEGCNPEYLQGYN